MSRRTPPWFAAGLLAALAVSPAFAQPANPWRGTTAGPGWFTDPGTQGPSFERPLTWHGKAGNPWRNAAPNVATETILYPPSHGTITLGLTVTGDRVTGGVDVEFEPAVAAAPMPRCRETECRAATCRTAVVAVVHDAPPVPAGKLTGTWYRETPGTVTAFTLAGTDLKMTTTANTGRGLITITLTADYAVTKDGVVHGVFTGADVDVNAVADPELSLELAGLSLGLQEMVDLPFAFRCRPCDGGLMVSHLRMPVSPGNPMDPVGALSGKYKTATGALPTPKAALMIGNVYSSDPNVLAQPGPAPLPYPQFGPPPPSYGALIPPPPCPIPGPPALCPVPSAPCPAQQLAGPPPEVRDTMQRVLNEMLGGPPQHSPYAAPPVCVPAGPPCPSPAVNPASYVVPQLPPLPPACNEQPVKVVPLTAPGQIPCGTWVREVGPMTYRIDAKDGYFTLTVTLTEEGDGQAMSVDHILVVESYPSRTDGQAVGLITGLDVTTRGLDADDGMELLDKLPEIQKAFTDKPVALGFRVYDDTLVIRNVRLPATGEDGDGMAKVFGTMGGRYTLSNGLPKAKPVKAKVVQSGMTLPSPNYLEHHPQYFSPDPTFPLPRELATQSDTVLSVAPMPAPAPLPAAKKPNPFRNGGVTDPQAWVPGLAEHVPYESDDLRQIGQVWRRFWFDDPSSPLAVERIHGGIEDVNVPLIPRAAK